jgi:hypothetical protein
MKVQFVEICQRPLVFDPAIWISKKCNVQIARARLIAELVGLRGQPDLHIGAPVFKGPTR